MTIRVERLRAHAVGVRLDLARLFPALILLGYGSFILSLFVRNSLTLYINPTYVWPTTLAGVVLVTLGVVRIARRGGVSAPCATGACSTEDTCGCGESSPRLWPYVWLCIPLLFAVLLPPRSLAAFSARQRGLQLAGISTIRSATTVSRISLSVDTSSFRLQDWIGALSADPNPQDYKNKPVVLTGLVMHDSASMPPGYILVMRYQVTCCIADARAEGLVVRDVTHGGLKDGQWVIVRGKMGETSYQGQQVAVVEPKQIAPTKVGNPYMY
jgi:uncharacterized repeat protein (TIGR03943 family)